MSTHKDLRKNSRTVEPAPSGLRRWTGFAGMLSGGATGTLVCLRQHQRQAGQTDRYTLPFRCVYPVYFGLRSDECRNGLQLASRNTVVGFELDIGVGIVTGQLQRKLCIQDKGAAK